MRQVILLLAAASLAAITLQGAHAQSTPPAAKPVRVGFICPFSGGSQDFGNSARLGAELAVKEINEVGGYLGRPIELVARDDKDVAKRGFTRVAVFADKTGYGEGGFKDVEKFLGDKMLKPVYSARFDLGAKSLTQQMLEAPLSGRRQTRQRDPAQGTLLSADPAPHQSPCLSASEVNASARNSSAGNPHKATKSRCADSTITGAPQA